MKQAILCLIMLALVLAAFAMKGERYAVEGMDYYNRGEYSRATQQFLAADRAADGSVPYYHFWLGRLYIAQQDTTNAIMWMDRYLASGDSSYVDAVKGYKEIITNQDKIFESVNLRPMPKYFNSRNSDYGAVADPQGKYLYFTSQRPTRFDKENIWRVEIFQSGYGKPELVTELASDANEAFGSFSADGSYAYIFGNYTKGRIDGDIFISQSKDKWSTPVPIDEINSPLLETHPFVVGDTLMFFTSSREGGYGGTDIWVSEKQDGVWGQPYNLGPNINTAGNEQTPQLVHFTKDMVIDGQAAIYDEKALYFASDTHTGFGGYDIFKAVHQGPGWDSWYRPQNLGLPVNSIRDDRYFNHRPGTNEVYISSDRTASTFEKVFLVYGDFTIPGYYVQQDSTGTNLYYPIEPDIIETDEPVEEKPQRYITFFGRVTDEKGNPVSTDITFSGSHEGEVYKNVATSDSTGHFEITLPWADPYYVVINPDGFMLFQQYIPAPSDDEPVNINFTIQRLEVKKVFIFNNIQFDFDKATLRPESYTILDDIVITMLNNPEISVEISGHTCSIGKAKYNQGLSERRAKAVVEYITGKGVEAERLTWAGHGESQPLNENKTKEERALNRRVEVKVLE
jgi:outer membrane protein OmpA-like peptidoglycan-associated protein